MQKLRQHMVMVGTLIGAHGLCLVLASIGCNSGPESGDGQGSGWVRYAALDEGPKPPPDVGLLDTQGLSLAGAERTVSYDFYHPRLHGQGGKHHNGHAAPGQSSSPPLKRDYVRPDHPGRPSSRSGCDRHRPGKQSPLHPLERVPRSADENPFGEERLGW